MPSLTRTLVVLSVALVALFGAGWLTASGLAREPDPATFRADPTRRHATDAAASRRPFDPSSAARRSGSYVRQTSAEERVGPSGAAAGNVDLPSRRSTSSASARPPVEQNPTKRNQSTARPPALEPSPDLESTADRLALPQPHRAARDASPRLQRPLVSVGTSLGALAIVLGLLFLVLWVLKRSLPASSKTLPSEVVEILGRIPLAERSQLHLLRIGQKLILVSLAAGVAETLTEINDPDEVNRLLGICNRSAPVSSTGAFRQMLHQFSRERPVDQFVDGASQDGSRAAMQTPGTGKKASPV